MRVIFLNVKADKFLLNKKVKWSFISLSLCQLSDCLSAVKGCSCRSFVSLSIKGSLILDSCWNKCICYIWQNQLLKGHPWCWEAVTSSIVVSLAGRKGEAGGARKNIVWSCVLGSAEPIQTADIFSTILQQAACYYTSTWCFSCRLV